MRVDNFTFNRNDGVKVLFERGNRYEVTTANDCVFDGSLVDITLRDSYVVYFTLKLDTHQLCVINLNEIKWVEMMSQCPKADVEPSNSMVNHPNHYQSEAGLEVIDVIEAYTAKLTGIEASDTANVIKYICRWKEKNGVQDLEKAKWYLEHLIDHVNKTEKEN